MNALRSFALLLALLITAPAGATPEPDPEAAPGAEARPARSLVDAYKKEYAFLEAERTALKARLEELERASRRAVAREEAAISRLQREILEARAEGDRIDRRLAEAEREDGRSHEQDALVAETLERARESLSEAGVELPERPEGAAGRGEELVRLVEGAARLIARRSTVRREDAAFFDAEGRKVEGERIHLGAVATWGVDAGVAGALAPAGGGELALWHQDAAETARTLAAGEMPETLRLFLYDDLDKAVSHTPDKTPREVVESGGVIAWVIVGLGALAALLLVLRLFILTWHGLGLGRFVDRTAELVARGETEEALSRAQRGRGAAGRVMGTTVAHLHREQGALEDRVSEALLAETPRIERFGSAITVFAAVAPLLGLLGTVTGMISTFDVITEHGTGDPKLLSGGISEALVTTELGLVVAIPTLLLGTLLAGRANQLQIRLERGALRVMNEARLAAERPRSPALAEPPPVEQESPWPSSRSSSTPSGTSSPVAAS